MARTKKTIAIVLHNVRSVYNVGSIFRTADAAGVKKIYLCGYTPTPVDRFGKARRDFAKVSLGAEKSVAWEYKQSAAGLIKDLKKRGYQIVALEQAPEAIDYRRAKIKIRAVLVFGNEVSGLPMSIRKSADVVAEIPMRGDKESLNVSVAAGVAMFRILGI
ncbi:MAG: TrmH family RNA methyltransferase [bacterium]|nr:TrmH family RNA methyltransferase [bacterium]